MSLPPAFTEQMNSLLTPSEFSQFQSAMSQSPSISVRLNPFKVSRRLPSFISSEQQVPWAQNAFYLSQRPDFTNDPLIHQGVYYVQEASSMFVEQAINRVLDILNTDGGNKNKPHLCIDLCAAPGGKSTLLRSLLPDNWLLLCNDIVRPRAEILKENILKWGHEGVVVTCNRPEEIGRLGGLADVMLIDAPCSGEGMFRKEEKAVSQWSPALVEECSRRQREIAEAAWPALKEGGFLIYSTCTFNTSEDEKTVRFICEQLGGQAVNIPIKGEWKIRGSLLNGLNMPVYRFLPHLTRGEGFFLALIRKTAPAKAIGIKGKSTLPRTDNYCASLLTGSEPFYMLSHNDEQWAIPANESALVETICKTLYPLSAGIPLYTLKGHKKQPHQGLALSRLVNVRAFPTVELSKDEALIFLRFMPLKISAPKGFVLLTHEGLGLGFCNNLGTRANNLYPKEWRIRKQ